MAHAATILAYEKDQLGKALDDEGAQSLVREFLREHDVIGQYRDPLTGFDATLFAHRKTHQPYAVNVGTEELRDFAADLHLGVRQLATDEAKKYYEAIYEYSQNHKVQPIFAGHSLGSAGAYYNALNYAHDTGAFASTYTPSGVGALSAINEFYETQPNAPQLHPDNKARVHTTMVYGSGDPVPTFGKQPKNMTAYAIASDMPTAKTKIGRVIRGGIGGIIEHPLSATTKALMDVDFDLSQLEQRRPVENSTATWAAENLGTYFDGYPDVFQAVKNAATAVGNAHHPTYGLDVGQASKPAEPKDYAHPSYTNYMLENNFAVEKGNYAGASQEQSPEDLMSKEQLDQQLAAMDNRRMADQASRTWTNEFVDVNKSTDIQNPRAGRYVMMPTSDYLGLDVEASAAKARARNVDTSHINLGRNFVADKPVLNQDLGALAPAQSVGVPGLDNLEANAISTAQEGQRQKDTTIANKKQDVHVNILDGEGNIGPFKNKWHGRGNNFAHNSF